jgi:hypothetical protein
LSELCQLRRGDRWGRTTGLRLVALAAARDVLPKSPLSTRRDLDLGQIKLRLNARPLTVPHIRARKARWPDESLPADRQYGDCGIDLE